MAISQLRRLFICAWGAKLSRLLSGVRRHDVDYFVCEFSGGVAGVLFFDLWTEVWVETDGFE